MVRAQSYHRHTATLASQLRGNGEGAGLSQTHSYTGQSAERRGNNGEQMAITDISTTTAKWLEMLGNDKYRSMTQNTPHKRDCTGT